MMTSSHARLLVPLVLILGAGAGAGCAEGLADAPGAAGSTGTSGGTSVGVGEDGGSGSVGPGGSGGGGSDAATGGSSSGGGSSDGASGAPAYNIDITKTSVSGLSAGGFFAVQFQVAFSSIMAGAAIFAGGPFDCAQGSLATALTSCTSPLTAPDVTPLVAATKQMASSGLIDDTSHLAAQHVFLFGGGQDTTVSPVVVDALATYYGSFLSASSITYENRFPGASHTMPTTTFGNACGVSSSPWISNCSYDGAGKGLAQIYGTLAPPATTLSGTFVSIAQGDFIANPASHSLADTAYAYVPASCASGQQCRVHISFHGCEQQVASVNDAYYKHAGFNEWADTNHIIVLYPQTIASQVSPTNPDACWDWWGYDGATYAGKSGTQMAMVRAMLGYLATGSGAIADAGTD